MSMMSKIRTHIRDIAQARSLSFAFYRFVHIVDRRFSLPKKGFFGKIFFSYEMMLEELLVPSESLVFVDVGAKYGIWTLRLANKFSQIHAFEPNPESYILLARNTHKLKNVNLYSCALGEKSGQAAFNIHKQPGHSGLAMKYEDYIRTITVPVRTLDSFGFRNVGLIKIDTEGYELPIIKGGKETIGREKPQLYIELHIQQQKSLILKLLKDFGYKYSTYRVSETSQEIIITNPDD